MRTDEGLLHVARLDGSDGAAHRLDAIDLFLGSGDELGDLGLDHDRSFEDVVVLEQVGLEREHLLKAQRPLLVPRTRQAESLIPRGELHGTGACVLAQRHSEHLEHDPLHVVLGLSLGEAERVDLHAVAKTAHLGIGHAVALTGDLLPQPTERAHLAHLFDEPHAGVDEERDATDDGLELLGRDLARIAYGVEHGDRGGQCVRELLRGRRAGFLQVIAADVERVPLGDRADRVGDHVGRQAQRRRGTEDVRAA